MYRKEKIDLIYRIVCLLTFFFVIIFVQNSLTLVLLVLFLIFLLKTENDLVAAILYLLTFLLSMLSYVLDYFIILKMILIIDYGYYFVKKYDESILKKYLKNSQEKINNERKDTIKEEELFRFEELKTVQRNNENAYITMYLAFHLIFLFLIVLVSSCVT